MQGRETDRENAAGIGRTAEGMVNVQAIRETGSAAIVGTRAKVDAIMNDGRVADIPRATLIEGMVVKSPNLLNFAPERGPSVARSSASTSTRLSKEALDALGKSICYYCKKPGQISKECWQLKDVVCHNCGQKGHQSTYCPQNKRGRGSGRGSEDGTSGSNSSGRSKSAEKRGECHNRGRTGHWAAECPHPKKQ